MTSVPISFRARVPSDDWTTADAAAAEGAGAALLLTHAGGPGAFTTNITVTGEVRPDSPDLEDLADASVLSLRQAAEDVEVLERAAAGSGAAPGLTQMLALRLPAESGPSVPLRQCQVFLAARDTSGTTASVMVVYLIALTAERDEMASLVAEFERFVASFELVAPDGATGGATG